MKIEPPLFKSGETSSVLDTLELCFNYLNLKGGSNMLIRLMTHKILKPQIFCSLILIGLMVMVINPSDAQDKSTEPLTVKGVEGTLALYHTIKIRVENLEKWVDQKDTDPSKFVLYIDGNAFTGLAPTLAVNNTHLQFDLKRTPESKDAWNAVLNRKPKGFTRIVPVTVRQDSVKVQGHIMAPLIVINSGWFWIFVLTFLASIILFWSLARKSDVIRVPGSRPEGVDDKQKPNRKPYSLARTQMAFWFFIIIISYVYIWMVTSDLSTLTTSVLALMGISAATGLSSAIVDSSKRSDQENQSRALEEKKKNAEVEAEKLQSEIAASNAANASPEQKVALATKQTELKVKRGEISDLNSKIQKLAEAAKPKASKGFINDILSDDDGISFHRFQMFAWTIILICIFIVSVFNSLSMPDFDTTLLALMGISSGTYIGFKLPQQQG